MISSNLVTSEIMAHLEESKSRVVISILGDYYEISRTGGVEPVFTKFIIIPLSETVIEDKRNNGSRKTFKCKICFVNDDSNEINISQEKISINGFKRIIMSIKEYGCIPEYCVQAIYELFLEIAALKLPSVTEYASPGLTLDNKSFVINNQKVNVEAPSDITEQQRVTCQEAYDLILSCCTNEKSALLLEILLISLIFEVIKKTSVQDRRCLLPTFTPYIFGASGTGKTTLTKALYAEMDSMKRVVSLSSQSTVSGVLKRISSVTSGMIVLDDVPHISTGKCSSDVTELVEGILRTYGDEGAEKVTFNSEYGEIRAWSVITAEALFLRVKSSVLRIMPIRLEAGEVNFGNIQELKRHKEKVDVLINCYINWFFGRAEYKDEKFVIKGLPELYYTSYDEIRHNYTDITSQRLIDSHAQMLMYFDFFGDFFNDMGIHNWSELKNGIKELLHSIGLSQELYIYETSLPCYINQCIKDFLTIGKVTELEKSGSSGYCEVDENCDAFIDDNYLILTAHQRKAFYNKIRSLTPNGNQLREKDINESLAAMNIVCDPLSKNIVTFWHTNGRVKFGKKETRIYMLNIKKFKEELE